jgi:molybdopterin-guanine dinucleotide biosynthesis protein A
MQKLDESQVGFDFILLALARETTNFLSFQWAEVEMEYESGGPLLKVLLLIRAKSSRMGNRKELFRFPDGRLAIEHALETLHSAVPSASTIYISLHDEFQLGSIEAPLKDVAVRARVSKDAEHGEHDEHDHDLHNFPELKPVFDEQEEDIGAASGLLAAHSTHPDAKWLVLTCDYPLLPPPALQQLILEYQNPVTCFVNESGFTEPLISIWDSEALEKLKLNVKNGRYSLDGVIKEINGRLIKPLRAQ